MNDKKKTQYLCALWLCSFIAASVFSNIYVLNQYRITGEYLPALPSLHLVGSIVIVVVYFIPLLFFIHHYAKKSMMKNRGAFKSTYWLPFSLVANCSYHSNL